MAGHRDGQARHLSGRNGSGRSAELSPCGGTAPGKDHFTGRKRDTMQQPDAWLRGPIEGVHPHLMPVAHALLQTADDIAHAVERLTTDELWLRPGGAASVGFHVRHIGGVVDRLFTYARGDALSPEQLSSMRGEADPGDPPAAAAELLGGTLDALERAHSQILNTPFDVLLQPRGVGRKNIPSNVIGLLFHAAEHAQRHVGQVVATARIIHGVSGRP